MVPTFLALSLAVLAIQSTPVANRFIRGEGNYAISPGNLHITNNVLVVDWGAGYNPVKPIPLKAGWFVYPDRPDWVWLFDGSDLSLLPITTPTAPGNNSWFWYRAVPSPVAEALPDNVRKRALGHGYLHRYSE